MEAKCEIMARMQPRIISKADSNDLFPFLGNQLIACTAIATGQIQTGKAERFAGSEPHLFFSGTPR